MEDRQILDMLLGGSQRLGIALDEVQARAFLAYLRELKAWNRRMNLTSIDDEKDIIIRHFLDSLAPCPYLSSMGSLLDIGAGAGFPGIPLKIALPGLGLTLLDSVEKKVHFMRHIIRTLGLKGAEALADRAESPELAYRLSGRFDCVISRAFAELEVFVTLGLPYLRPGGTLIAMKGPAVAGELKALQETKGISTPELFETAIPFSDRRTSLVIIKKL